MILEGIMTTLRDDGGVNIAPMGPMVDEAMDRLILRPFQTSTTYANLKRTGQGVFHVTDDVLLIAQGAIGAIEPMPEMLPATAVEGRILVDCCRWYAVRVVSIDDRHSRTEVIAEVVDRGVRREFFGFNRARHAVLEAAIVATRLHILASDQIRADFDRLLPLVEKTGGPRERQAFSLLERHVRDALAIAELNRTPRATGGVGNV